MYIYIHRYPSKVGDVASYFRWLKSAPIPTGSCRTNAAVLAPLDPTPVVGIYPEILLKMAIYS